VIGLERMIHSVKDTLGCHFYYWNNARIKLYMTGYKESPVVAQVGLLSKDDSLTVDARSTERIRFVGGYTAVPSHDYVHKRAEIIQGNAEQYNYFLNGKIWLNGARVFIINFYSKKADTKAGILYIDTATYAFVRILCTDHHVKKTGFIDLDKVTTFTQYSKSPDGWGLDAVKVNSLTAHNGYTVERTDGFQTAAVNTTNSEPLPEQAIIFWRMIDDQVQPFNGFKNSDNKISREIRKKAELTFMKIHVPRMASRSH